MQQFAELPRRVRKALVNAGDPAAHARLRKRYKRDKEIIAALALIRMGVIGTKYRYALHIDFDKHGFPSIDALTWRSWNASAGFVIRDIGGTDNDSL